MHARLNDRFFVRKTSRPAHRWSRTSDEDHIRALAEALAGISELQTAFDAEDKPVRGVTVTHAVHGRVRIRGLQRSPYGALVRVKILDRGVHLSQLRRAFQRSIRSDDGAIAEECVANVRELWDEWFRLQLNQRTAALQTAERRLQQPDVPRGFPGLLDLHQQLVRPAAELSAIRASIVLAYSNRRWRITRQPPEVAGWCAALARIAATSRPITDPFCVWYVGLIRTVTECVADRIRTLALLIADKQSRYLRSRQGECRRSISWDAADIRATLGLRAGAIAALLASLDTVVVGGNHFKILGDLLEDSGE